MIPYSIKYPTGSPSIITHNNARNWKREKHETNSGTFYIPYF